MHHAHHHPRLIKNTHAITFLLLGMLIVFALGMIINDDEGPWANIPLLWGYDPDPTTGEFNCGDHIDNDSDGLVDCEDIDSCSYSVHCPENCSNMIDDDGDGAIDCADRWCKRYDPNCQA